MATDNTPELEPGAHAAHGEIEAVHAEHEKPEDWGWHREFPVGRQIGGWFSVIVLGLYLTGWHYNHGGTFAILLIMAFLVAGLLWDRKRRRTQWRQ
jgi:hypothetical protein